MRNDRAFVLLVDDDPVICAMTEQIVKSMDCEIETVSLGEKAIDFVMAHKSDIDVLLLDRQLPDMKGLDIALDLKNDKETKKIPIIMQTASDRADDIRDGIEAGVFYYLAKPIDQGVLKSVLNAAFSERKKKRALDGELHQYAKSFNLIDICILHIKSLEEAEGLAAFLANCFPDKDRVVTGLSDLLINAIEHGNLGIGYEEKGRLIKDGIWREEILRRSRLPPNKDKSVEISYRRNDKGHVVTICDQGNGFEWKKYLQINPVRSMSSHGRGIARAFSSCFDRLSYNDKGNEVVAFVSSDKPLSW